MRPSARAFMLISLLIGTVACSSGVQFPGPPEAAGSSQVAAPSSTSTTPALTESTSSIAGGNDAGQPAATTARAGASPGPGGSVPRPAAGTRADHPRLLLTPEVKDALRAKVAANDATWRALKARADALATYRVFRYENNPKANNYAYTGEPDMSIFYDYEGEGWFGAAMPLALAYQMTGDAKYAGKLIQLAEEMERAQADPVNQPNNGGQLPLRVDNYYPTRYLGPTLAVIYDWCFDALDGDHKRRIIALINVYYDDMRANAYQRNDYPDGNYFPGIMFAAAAGGYATVGDNPRAPEMIAYARARFDGAPSALLGPGDIPLHHMDQAFDGGVPTQLAVDNPGVPSAGAPFKSGFDFQGWGGYASATYGRLIFYLLAVRSATGEDLLTPHLPWFSAILHAEKAAVLPDGFQIDPSGDWGGDYGAAVQHELPLLLAAVLAGTPDGPAAEHFAYQELPHASPYPREIPDEAYREVYEPPFWESFLFGDPTRPSAPLAAPLSYSAFGPPYPIGGATNGAPPYFIMRSDAGLAAVWASVTMGAAWYNDHQHANAGHLAIVRGGDHLLVDAGGWDPGWSPGVRSAPPASPHGIYGGPTEEDNAAAANTLYFDDYGDFQAHDQTQYLGGQGVWGLDQVSAAEQTDTLTYVRGDLSTAYNRNGPTDQQSGRKLNHFYRTFVYVRPLNTFVVYDQVQVEPSGNRKGPYRKEVRWHFPSMPAVGGRRVQIDQGSSRLTLDIVAPGTPSLRVVDESNNPDDGVIPCTDEGCETHTWRLEVSGPAGDLAVPFLTVLQPGDHSSPPFTVAPLAATGGGPMTGVRLSRGGAVIAVLLLNDGPGPTPPPIASVAYPLSAATSALHVLAGLAPGARYRMTALGGEATVARDDAGPLTASPAGVLTFGDTR